MSKLILGLIALTTAFQAQATTCKGGNSSYAYAVKFSQQTAEPLASGSHVQINVKKAIAGSTETIVNSLACVFLPGDVAGSLACSAPTDIYHNYKFTVWPSDVQGNQLVSLTIIDDQTGPYQPFQVSAKLACQ